VKKVYFEGQLLKDIAKGEGVSDSAIAKRMQKIYRKLKKNLN